MRSPRTSESGESLQLLVDPMCNLFAGLVLLSVFLALFAGSNRGEKRVEPDAAAGFANAELLQRRLQETRAETERLRSANQDMAARLDGARSLPSLGAVQKALAQAEEAAGGGATITREDMKRALESELDRLREEEVSLENEAAGLRKESTRLQERWAGLGRQNPEGNREAEEVRLRLPRARPTDKLPLYLLVSGGRVYPVQLPSGAEDEIHVDRERSPSEDRILPRPGKGLAPGRPTEDFLRQIDTRRCYPVLVVYADSFPQYRDLRKMLEAMNQPFGWEPRETGTVFRLSARGFKPEAQ